MIYSIPLLQFVFYIEYWWLRKVNERYGETDMTLPYAILGFTFVGLFGQSIGIATIDTGDMSWNIHFVGAAISFVLHIIACCLIDKFFKDHQKKHHKTISNFSYMVKCFTACCLVFAILIMMESFGSNHSNAAEFVLTGLFMVYQQSFYPEWEGISVAVRHLEEKESKLNPQEKKSELKMEVVHGPLQRKNRIHVKFPNTIQEEKAKDGENKSKDGENEKTRPHFEEKNAAN